MRKFLPLLLLLNACAGVNNHVSNYAPMTTVPQVELNRYLGKWHELAAIPIKEQANCVRDTSATYSMVEDGLIKVDNRCIKADGTTMMADGRARVVDSKSNAKLEVAFFRLPVYGWVFIGDYWVIDLARDYRYAIVGHPSRNYAWVLARNTELSTADWQNVKTTLTGQGYDLCRVLRSNFGSAGERKPLCQ